jgi:hypothetical protein
MPLSNVFGAICYELTEMFLLSNTCPAGWMQVIIGSHVVSLEGKLLLIAIAIVRIALNVNERNVFRIILIIQFNIDYVDVADFFQTLGNINKLSFFFTNVLGYIYK